MSVKYFLLLFNFFILSEAFAKDRKFPAAENLLKEADRARGADVLSTGITWTAEVTSKESRIVFRVKVKNTDVKAEAEAPPKHMGEVLLFNDKVMWFYKPGLKKPVKKSSRQNLMGQAANGDIAATNYARDYEGTVVAEETVGKTPSWKLELKARDKSLTYDRIRYWISKDQKLGVKAEFLTLSGEVFKTALFEYKNEMKSSGITYPFVSKMTIHEAIHSQDETVIIYTSPVEEKHDSRDFNINTLVR